MPTRINASENALTTQKWLVLEPMISTKPSETHAALVISRNSFENVLFNSDFKTIKQLRKNSAPNPWETAWAVFNYTGNKNFYYVAFKTNGWELGKADPAYPGSQRFLASGRNMASPVGTQHRFSIKTVGAHIIVLLDGTVLTTITDTERPYLSGKIGFYTEDAQVAFDNVTGSLTENFDRYNVRYFGDNWKLGNVWTIPFVGFGTGAIQSTGSDRSTPSTGRRRLQK